MAEYFDIYIYIYLLELGKRPQFNKPHVLNVYRFYNIFKVLLIQGTFN